VENDDQDLKGCSSAETSKHSDCRTLGQASKI